MTVKQNLPPGTLVYTGKHHLVEPEMTLIAFDGPKYIKKVVQTSDFEMIDKLSGVKWLNITGLSHMDLIKTIGDRYQIDPMILEDIVHVEQRTKIEIKSGQFLFAVFKMIYLNREKQGIDHITHIKHEHISFLLIQNLLITFQEEHGDVFDGVRERISDETRKIRERGVDYLFYTLIDAIVDHQMEVMLSLQNDIDSIEERIVEYDIDDIEPLYHLRKSLTILKAGAMPIQETLMRLITQETPMIRLSTKEFFRDVIDHAAHLSDRIMTNREVVASLFDMHQTNVSNNMNRVMTTLTIFSAIFIPLSFLTGFFGMNFQVFPSLSYALGVPIFIGSCLLIAVLMLGFFKWKKWF